MNLNQKTLFAYIRKAPFGGRLTQEQVDGVQTIIKYFERSGGRDLRHLAYILATAFHETGGRMIPVREGFAKTDARARKIVSRYKYSKPDPETGHVYYGRGHVQLTWAENYKRMGKILGLPLYKNPDLALETDVSARILIEGMTRGLSATGDFTGKSVDQYFNDIVDDPVGARRIVNGTDKAALIAGYHKNFLDALEAAQAEDVPDDITEADATPDKPNLATDSTTMGTISAVAGSGAFGLLSAVNSPWAFMAFAVLALGVFLFITGRIKIVKKAGA